MFSIKIIVSSFFVSAVLICFSIFAQAADNLTEVSAIHAMNQQFVKAFNSNNIDAVTSLYDEHAILLPPGSTVANGKAAIHAYFETHNAGSLIFALGDKPDGGVSGNMGWASGTYTIKDKSGNIVSAGNYLNVTVKKDAKWLYLRDAWN